MCFKKIFFIFIFSCLNVPPGVAQNKTSETFFNSTSLDSIERFISKAYTLKQYNKAFDIAVNMASHNKNIETKKKGVNLLALLAKNLANQIEIKAFDIVSEETKILISRFEQEKYFIQLPKVSRFIKTMNYFCNGEYRYVHQKLKSIIVYKIFVFFLFIYFVLFFVCFFKNFNWKFKQLYKRLTIYLLIVFLMIFIIFNLTCQNNIKDYSFYGIFI
jgi:hypothetical protein